MAKGKTRKVKLPVKTTVLLQRGDIIEIKTAGGGGYGRPESGDKSRIRDDIENGIITPSYGKQARETTKIAA